VVKLDGLAIELMKFHIDFLNKNVKAQLIVGNMWEDTQVFL